jgi:hypothetical protein
MKRLSVWLAAALLCGLISCSNPLGALTMSGDSEPCGLVSGGVVPVAVASSTPAPSLDTVGLVAKFAWDDYDFNAGSTAVWNNDYGAVATQSTEAKKPVVQNDALLFSGQYLYWPYPTAWTNPGAPPSSENRSLTVFVRMKRLAVSNYATFIQNGAADGWQIYADALSDKIQFLIGGVFLSSDTLVTGVDHVYAFRMAERHGTLNAYTKKSFWRDGVKIGGSEADNTSPRPSPLNASPMLWGIYYNLTSFKLDAEVKYILCYGGGASADKSDAQMLSISEYLMSLP